MKKLVMGFSLLAVSAFAQVGGGTSISEYSNETPWIFDAITSLTRTVNSLENFDHQLFIEDFDKWLEGTTVTSRANYDTNFTVQRQSGGWRANVTPNPVVTRPANGRNKFTYLITAMEVSNDTTYIDRFTPIDEAGTIGPNGTKDTDGSTIAITVVVKKMP